MLAVRSKARGGVKDDFFDFFDNEQLLTPHYLVILGTRFDSTLCIKSVL